jgi:Holliday junction resolvasome RuvABC endonuclease subunit
MSRNQTILGIDINTREYGIALFEGDNLEFAEVKSLKNHKTTDDKCQALHNHLSRIVLREQPALIVYKHVNKPYQETGCRKALFNTLLLVAVKNKIMVKTYQSLQVRETCVGPGDRPTRKNMCEHLARTYPSLQARLKEYWKYKNTSWRYWSHLFNAVAAVHTYLVKTREA